MRFRQHSILGSLLRFGLALLPGILMIAGRRTTAAAATTSGTSDAMCSYYRSSSTRAVLEICTGEIGPDLALIPFTQPVSISPVPTADKVNAYLEKQNHFINKSGMSFLEAANKGLVFLKTGAPHNASIRLTNCNSENPDKVRVGKGSVARFLNGPECAQSRQPEIVYKEADPQTNLLELDIGNWEKNSPTPAMLVAKF